MLGLNDIYEKHGRRPQPWIYWVMVNVTNLRTGIHVIS